MTDLKKTIKKLSGYHGPTLKSIIPKARSINQILGIKKRKTEFHKIIVASQKILFKRPKKRSIRRKKGLVRNLFKIPKISRSKVHKIGDAEIPVPPTSPTIFTSSSTSQRPQQQITNVQQVIYIKLSDKGKKDLKSALNFGRRFHKKRIKDIGDEMRQVHSSLLAYAAILIAKHVPRDTGDLQSSLLGSLSSGKKPPMFVRHDNQLELQMGFFSNIYYLPYVNRPKRDITVRHHRNMGIISYRGGRHYLHDPTAKTLFMLTTKEAIRKEAKRLVKDMINRLRRLWGHPYTYGSTKALFKFPGMGRF